MRTAVVRAGAAAAVLLVLAGCGAAASDPTSAASSSATATPAAPVVPENGRSLAALGFVNGPTTRVFLPVGTAISSQVDQPNNVTLVLTSPSAATLAAYLRESLVANGFVVTADDRASSTFTVTGWGFRGTFTGDAQASALLFRPA